MDEISSRRAATGYAQHVAGHAYGGVTRRQVLSLSLAALGGFGWLFKPSPGRAAPPAAAALPTAPSSEALAGFLRFSQAITAHPDIDTETATRIYIAMQRASADFSVQMSKLAAMAPPGTDADTVLASATAANLRETALAVVAAWYTGSVGSDSNAVVVSYADALMFRPVADAQTPPTYCGFGPGWWTVAPPPVGVSAPVERPTEPPPTTGFPVPTTGTPAPPKSTPQPAAPATPGAR
jgi:hypothetical protein